MLQPIVTYDTSVAVTATWGTPDYTVGEGQIAIPITFAADVVVAGAEVFRFTPVAPLVDSDLEGLRSGDQWRRHGLDVDGDTATRY